MPTKRNKADQQQPYVPAGNGDASGEYADHESGSNKHFTNFFTSFLKIFSNYLKINYLQRYYFNVIIITSHFSVSEKK